MPVCVAPSRSTRAAAYSTPPNAVELSQEWDAGIVAPRAGVTLAPFLFSCGTRGVSCEHGCERATLTTVGVSRKIKSMQTRRSVLMRYKRYEEANGIQRDVHYLRAEELISDALSLPAPLTPRERHALVALLSLGETGGDRDLGQDRAQLP